jgi:hypothetical protein
MTGTGLFDSLESSTPSAEESSAPLYIAAVALEPGVDRLLDPNNTSITLNTMAKGAHLLGKCIKFAMR